MGDGNDQDLHPLSDIDRVIHSPARLMVMTYLYVVDSTDYLFLMRLTGLTWGNLASHLAVLEREGYIEIEKKFVGKKPQSMIRLTDTGQSSFQKYKSKMQAVLGEIPD